MKLDSVAGLYKDTQQVEGGESDKYFALFAGEVNGKAILSGDGGNIPVDPKDLADYKPGEKVYFDGQGHQLMKQKQAAGATTARKNNGCVRDPQRGQSQFD